MAHFAAAIACFLLAQALMAAGFCYPLHPLQAPETLAVVHLLTIGWLSTLLFGALYQFVPVITGAALPSRNLPLVALLSIQLGLFGMLAGFLGPLYGFNSARFCLPAGGMLVSLGFALGAGLLLVTLLRARPLGLPARFIAAGQIFLLLTFALGFCFSLALAIPGLPDWLTDLPGHALWVHALAGLAGWFTLTAMGVAYRLLSMFMLAPERDHSRRGRWSFRLAAGGIALTAAGGLWLTATQQRWALPLAGLIAGAGALLYLAEMRGLYRARQRRALELNSRAAAAAFAALALSLALLAGLAATRHLAAHAGTLGLLVMFGWLSGLGLSQLYKIIPFLTWLERYGSKLGHGRVPRVQDLVDERRAAPWFVLYGLAVALAVAADLADLSRLVQIAFAVQLLASLALSREFWRARHAAPERSPTLPRKLAGAP